MFKNPCVNVLIIVTVLLLLAWWAVNKHPRITITTEPFVTDPSPELAQYYLPITPGKKGLLIDTLQCSPDCCGESWYVPFDGLTPSQIQKRIATGVVGDGGPYIRTNYTCGDGKGGSGCPCVTKDAYLNLANRGQPYDPRLEHIDPTFYVGGNLQTDKPVPARIRAQDGKSVFVPHPRLNDLELQREPQNISNLQVSPFN